MSPRVSGGVKPGTTSGFMTSSPLCPLATDLLFLYKTLYRKVKILLPFSKPCIYQCHSVCTIF